MLPRWIPSQRAHRSLRIDVASGVAVVRRVGIDDEPHRAVPLRFARLDPAERASVTRQRDLAAHVLPERVERLVVVDQTVVDVHDVGGDVAVARVRVERGNLRPARRRVLWYARLAQHQRRRRPPGDEQPGRDAVRVREVDRVLLRPGFESPGPQLLHHVVASRRLRCGARNVRYTRQVVGHLARARRVGHSDQAFGETVLSASRRSSGAQHKQECDDDPHDGASW